LELVHIGEALVRSGNYRADFGNHADESIEPAAGGPRRLHTGVNFVCIKRSILWFTTPLYDLFAALLSECSAVVEEVWECPCQVAVEHTLRCAGQLRLALQLLHDLAPYQAPLCLRASSRTSGTAALSQ